MHAGKSPQPYRLQFQFRDEGKIWEEGPAAKTLAKPSTPELGTFLSGALH